MLELEKYKKRLTTTEELEAISLAN